PPKAGEPKLALEEGERGWFVDGFHFRSLPLGGEGSTGHRHAAAGHRHAAAGHRHAALVPSLTSPPGLPSRPQGSSSRADGERSMTASRVFSFEGDGQAPVKATVTGAPHPAIVSAVKEDIRQTLRSAWIDPALEVAAQYPIFFTAAWSAIRPNVGKSFQTLARSVRGEAAEAIRPATSSLDLRKDREGALSDEERHRVEACARAA